MEHWRGFGPPTWSLGAPWASNLGSLGSFEVSKSGSCNGLRLQVGVSKPAFAEDMVLQAPIDRKSILYFKTIVVLQRLGPPAGIFGVLWIVKMRLGEALGLQVKVLEKLWGLQVGVLQRLAALSWGVEASLRGRHGFANSG